MSKDIEMFSEFATSGRVVVFDTETTGGSCSDEICQLAAAEYVNGRLERTMNVYIRPTCEMNPWAEQIHGISMAYLDEHGIDPVDALQQFFEFLGSDVLLVAHNNRFDLKMLQQECAKFDCAFEPDGVVMCDTLALARYFRPDLKSHALGNLLGPLGVDGVNSHDALDDVMACAGVFFKLLDRQGSGTPNGGGTPSTRPTFFPWPQGDTSAAVNEGSRYRRRQCARLLQAASGSAP